MSPVANCTSRTVLRVELAVSWHQHRRTALNKIQYFKHHSDLNIYGRIKSPASVC